MPSIEKQLKEWSEQGIISHEQASKILAHESSKPRASWIQYGLLILGVFVMGLGIISLIAANWNEINDYIKLIVDFLLLTTIGLLGFRAHKSQQLVMYDSFLLALQITSLASIGLISQIFHASGDWYDAILFWCAITLPAVISSTFVFVPLIWIAGFLTCLSSLLMDSTFLGGIFYHKFFPVFILCPLIASILGFLAQSIKCSNGTTKAIRFSLYTACLVVTAVIDIGRAHPRVPLTEIKSFFPAYILSLIILSLVWTSSLFKPLQKQILTVLIAIYVLSTHQTFLSEPKAIYFATFSIFELGLMGLFLASIKSRKGFNFILMLAGLRFFALFIEALGGLAVTGFGLILSGIILISLASVWHRRRHEIAQWAERIAQ